MPPTLFLDIDGVLATRVECTRIGSDGITSDIDQYGYDFRQDAVDSLSRIVDKTGCKIVLSSAWRVHGLEWMQAMWKHRGYPGEFIDVTGRREASVILDDRSAEILQWLAAHKEVKNWCAIDDEPLFILNWIHRQHHVNIKSGYYGDGLTAAHADRAIRILTK